MTSPVCGSWNCHLKMPTTLLLPTSDKAFAYPVFCNILPYTIYAQYKISTECPLWCRPCRLPWPSQRFSVSHASDSLRRETSWLPSMAGSGSSRSVPWLGAPQAGQDSTLFDVISAPQHPQNAAMCILRRLQCSMISAQPTILRFEASWRAGDVHAE